MNVVDIAIVGAGLAGTALSAALQNTPFRVALIDAHLPVSPSATIEQKGTKALALSLPSVRCLEKLDVLTLSSDALTAIKTVKISKQGQFGLAQLNAAHYQLPALGYVIDSAVLSHALNKVVETLPNTTFFRPTRILELDKKADGWEILLQNTVDPNQTSVLKAKLLVGADGTHSFVRQKAGIDWFEEDYQQTAIVVNIECPQSPENAEIAYERFLEKGSIALLPLGGRDFKCVWMVENKRAEVFKNDPAGFENLLNALQAAFGYQLGYFKLKGAPFFYPLKKCYSKALYAEGLVLVGNAANTLSPIAAQGFNLGLRDIAFLAETLVDAHKAGEAINTISLLKTYALLRESDHAKTHYFTDSIAENGLLQGFGILATAWLKPFRQYVLHQGLGQTARLPKLCRQADL